MKPAEYIAYRLRCLGVEIMEFLCSLADLINRPAYFPTPEENALSVEGLRARILHRKNNPCQTCKSEGALATDDGKDCYVCPDCGGLGVDIKKITETLR